MKTIGILGGMSWESTRTYYRLINEGYESAWAGSIPPASCSTALISPTWNRSCAPGNGTSLATSSAPTPNA